MAVPWSPRGVKSADSRSGSLYWTMDICLSVYCGFDDLERVEMGSLSAWLVGQQAIQFRQPFFQRGAKNFRDSKGRFSSELGYPIPDVSQF